MIGAISRNAATFNSSETKESAMKESAFAVLLNEKQKSKMTAKDFLKTLSVNSLNELQAEHCLANPINCDNLTVEGAENLFVAKADKRHYCDLNNDGIVEIGIAKTFIFPPVNAPDAVKSAWEKAVENMTLGERLIAEAPFLVAQLIANIRTQPDGRFDILSPEDAGYRNAFGSSIDFYATMMKELKNSTVALLQNAGPAEAKNLGLRLKTINRFMEYLCLD